MRHYTNIEIRRKIAEAGMTQNDLAKLLGYGLSTLQRRLRREMDPDEQKLIINLIEARNDPVRRAEIHQKYVSKYRRKKRHQKEAEIEYRRALREEDI